MTAMPAPVRGSQPMYRERLAPSLWLIVGAGVVAPMSTLVFVGVSPVFSLAIGLAVAVAVVACLIGLAPRLVVDGTTLRAGRAHIDVGLLGEPIPLTGDEARAARGQDLAAGGWVLIRGGIDGVVVVPVNDPDDPTTAWTISTRTPERLAVSIAFAQRGAVAR
ncbi:DUF3093 family protein [Microbacterium sp. JB110]|uniref:DUF3093 family protein n=1 Tax=Microbacterium sp. JB110 TaxID=2024477 RepID=UPI00097F1AB8|nr:DUF3093 family protein [Microbacterium sp. JB110]SJM52337.1 Membrane protein [Frigoribacterium sp. JB110]